MLSFFASHAGTIVALLLVAAAAAGSIVHLRRQRKNGKSTCGCNCGNCHGSCHTH